jgi:uncharacterized protein (DUF305 family)
MQFQIRRVAATAAVAVAATAVMGGAQANAASKANAVDRAFVREMIPHHQMAVEMARMGEMQGEHAEIKTLSAAIVKDQNAEIRTLKRIARSLGVTPAKMPSGNSMGGHEQMMRDAETLGLTMHQMGMSMDMKELDGAKPFDRKFIDMMITHHRGAIRMARAGRAKGKDASLRKIARAIITAQAKEIRQMNAWRTQWYGATSPSGGVPR